MNKVKAQLVLADGTTFEGYSFGFPNSTSGEVVFNTGMVGYPQSFTDPSYAGQILCLTYPLIGNYGIPESKILEGLEQNFESDKIHIQGLVVSKYAEQQSHYSSKKTLQHWLKEQKIPAIYGIDTRALTKKLRTTGVMLGKIIVEGKAAEQIDGKDVEQFDPNVINIVANVSCKEPIVYGQGKKKIAVIDCGVKLNIIRCLLKRGVQVIRVPWNFDILNSEHKVDGVVISNGPGDPKIAKATIENVKKILDAKIPSFGICLGNQIMALSAGADTYKLKFGHRAQNQPCNVVGTQTTYITSQNHGFAVDEKTLPSDWEAWMRNVNDNSNEGIKHKSLPFMAVQFHPEANPGPKDAEFLFDKFLEMVKGNG